MVQTTPLVSWGQLWLLPASCVPPVHLLAEQVRSRTGLAVEQGLAITKTFLCYQHCLHDKSKTAAVMRRIRTLFQLKRIQWLWWGNAGLAAASTSDYKLTFPHFRKCWARSQGNELTFWICIPFASDICNQSCWWYAWMAADRNDRVSVIAGTLSAEAPPSNAAQWMPASDCPSKTLCFLCLPSLSVIYLLGWFQHHWSSFLCPERLFWKYGWSLSVVILQKCKCASEKRKYGLCDSSILQANSLVQGKIKRRALKKKKKSFQTGITKLNRKRYWIQSTDFRSSKRLIYKKVTIGYEINYSRCIAYPARKWNSRPPLRDKFTLFWFAWGQAPSLHPYSEKHSAPHSSINCYAARAPAPGSLPATLSLGNNCVLLCYFLSASPVSLLTSHWAQTGWR